MLPAALLAISHVGYAGEAAADAPAFKMGIHLGSYHEQPGYNNFNPGVFIRSTGNFYGVVGAYYNSESHASVYIGAGYEYKYFGLMVGAVNGYERNAVSPIALPYIKLPVEIGPLSAIRVGVIPRVEGINDGWVAHLMAEF